MADGAPTADTRTRSKKRFAWRRWLRALHRDFGYLVVGLTVVYALSGLAVNHIDDWNANYREFEQSHQLSQALPEGDQAIAAAVLHELAITDPPDEVFRVADDEIEILLDERTLSVNPETRVVLDRGREPRFFLKTANWLHLNRGKKAWTYIADGYAVLLLFLALSGLFMLPGRKGLIGRGGILVIAGSAVPIAYVLLSG